MSHKNSTNIANHKKPEYRIWSGIIARCTKPRIKNYHNYGGRGITVCERWRSFDAFFTDMGPRPSPKHSVDRIDNDRGYSPDNCRWSTKREQLRNTRRNVNITIDGITRCTTEWAELKGIHPNLIYYRINELHWDPVKAVSTPNDRRRNRKSVIWLTIHGQTHCLMDWAAISDINDKTIRRRLSDGWSPEDAVFKPSRQRSKQSS